MPSRNPGGRIASGKRTENPFLLHEKKPDKEQTSQSAPYPAVVSLNNAPAEWPYSAGKGCFQDTFCFLNLGSQ